MSYVKQQWVDGQTKVDAAHLNHIEQGIADVESAIPDVSQFATKDDTYTKEQIDAKISSVMSYKGTVATVEDLPNSATVGDVYNVTDTGMNYAWNGSQWDALGSDVDLSNYVTNTQFETELAKKQPVGDYATVEQLNTQLAEKQPVGDYATTQELNVGLATKQEVGDYPVYQKFSAGADPSERKTIQLANADSISGISTTGNGANLIMLSKWDKVDIGSTKYQMNLNSPDGVVQINDEKVVATTDQIPDVSNFVSKSMLASELATKQDAGDYALKSEIPDTSNFATYAEVTDGLATKQDKGDYATNEVVQAEFESYDKTIKTYIEQQVTSKADQVEVDSLDSRVDVVESISGSVYTMQSQIAQLMDQVQQLKTPTVEPVEISAEQPSVDQPDQDVSFSATVNGTVGTITAKSIQSANASIQSGRLAATATNDVSIKNLSTSGDLAKSTANAGLSVNTDEYVTITGADWQQTGYNGIEVGLSSAPKSVLIDSVDFKSTMSNNAISIFSWQENAVITISNCHFANVSNPLRLSNRDNKPCTINIVNCTCDQWVAGEYAGFICMQDYTSSSAQAAQEANQFGKLTINFVNCIGPDGRIVGNAQQLAENHIIYVYTDQEGLIAFGDGSRYPTVIAQ